MEKLQNIFKYLGILAPIILFFYSLFLLKKTKNYFFVFIIGCIFNNILNIILKLIFNQSRPDNSKIIELGLFNGRIFEIDKLGMPSGHAQNCGFELMFITLVFNNPSITTLYLIFSLISLMQRVLYNRHDILQVVFGFIIGLLVGYIFYTIAKKNIIGYLKMKDDDYGPK
jgi:membrane-associated phospholipid phosphatase